MDENEADVNLITEVLDGEDDIGTVHMVVTAELEGTTTGGGTHGVHDLDISMAELKMVMDMITRKEEYWRLRDDLLDEYSVVP